MKQPTKPKSGEPSPWAESMGAAESKFGVLKAIQKAAKSAGCDAFVTQRVHGPRLLAWIKKHPEICDQVAESAAEKGTDADLRRERMRLGNELLQAKLDEVNRTTIPKAEAKSEWSRAMAILLEEFKSLMDADLYRVAVIRARERVGEVLP